VFTIQADVLDPKTGKLRPLVKPRVANTLTQNWIKMLYVSLSQQTLTTSVPDTGTPTNRTVAPSSGLMALNATAGTTASGIVIGTGSGSAGITDTKLITQYTNTTNFTHGAMAAGQFSLNTSGSEYQLLIQRTFTNTTGADITFTEAGLYADYSTHTYFFCIDHTMFGFTVKNGAGNPVTLTYTYQTP
jgi:hypothetical protein